MSDPARMPPPPDWPGPGEAARAFEAAANPGDAVIAEGKAKAEAALGCEVVAGNVYQAVPASDGRLFVQWVPKRWWHKFRRRRKFSSQAK